MRSQKHMMDLLLNFAATDERVRAVILNGSRVTDEAPADPFQDIDVLFVVDHMETFTADHSWVDFLGEIMVQQLPDLIDAVTGPDNHFAYLLQFQDGNRVDLSLIPRHNAIHLVKGYGPGIVLLDKEGGAETFLLADPSEFITKRPTVKQYQDCCNEFWWVAPYVAKGIWRGQLSYAIDHFYLLKDCLHYMLCWYIGGQHDYAINVGKSGKYLQKYLTAEEWAAFIKTYPAGNYAAIWQALYAMCDLFRFAANKVADDIETVYPEIDDANVMAHLRYVQQLAPDAVTLYPDRA